MEASLTYTAACCLRWCVHRDARVHLLIELYRLNIGELGGHPAPVQILSLPSVLCSLPVSTGVSMVG